MDAADDPIGRGGELTHLTALHFAIHLIQTRAKRLVQPGSLDVFGDANDLESSGGVVVNLGSHREEGPDNSSRLRAGVDNTDVDPAAFECLGYSADLLPGRQPRVLSPCLLARTLQGRGARHVG